MATKLPLLAGKKTYLISLFGIIVTFWFMTTNAIDSTTATELFLFWLGTAGLRHGIKTGA